MTKLQITHHPSYGYATAELVRRLVELKDGMEYKQLLKQIELQTKKKGKIE